MSAKTPAIGPLLAAAVLTAVLALAGAAPASAAAGAIAWRLEQPLPPEAGGGVPPAPLGRIGDIEFFARNRGLLITAGNGSPAVKPGVWAYNGRTWHELAVVCGATDGRIAWAGPDEFWTISDGRAGQAPNPLGQLPPLEDNSLCRFSGGRVVESFATPAFQANSYPALHAAGCISTADCWFGGEPVAEPSPPGAFHVHWNGRAVTPEPNQAGHAVWDMRLFEGHLYESVRRGPEDRPSEPNPELGSPSVVHRVEPEAGIAANEGSAFALLFGLPLGQPAEELDYLHLSADQESLWAAAGRSRSPEGLLTVLRFAGGAWQQLLGPEAGHGELLPSADAVTGIAAEPGGNGAWITLDTTTDVEHPSPTAPALVAHIAPDGTVSEEQTLGAKGAAYRISCPAAHDCWMATTQGWLYHLAPEGEQQVAEDTDPAFSHLIAERPSDESTPQTPPDALPIDDSGLLGEQQTPGTYEAVPPERGARVTVPLLSKVKTRMHGTTLELRFHLAVKARLRLVAKRGRSIVASTPSRTLAAGNRSLLLHLNVHRWPTKLDLQSRALAPLPTVSAAAPSVGTISTSLAFPGTRGLLGSGFLH